MRTRMSLLASFPVLFSRSALSPLRNGFLLFSRLRLLLTYLARQRGCGRWTLHPTWFLAIQVGSLDSWADACPLYIRMNLLFIKYLFVTVSVASKPKDRCASCRFPACTSSGASKRASGPRLIKAEVGLSENGFPMGFVPTNANDWSIDQ